MHDLYNLEQLTNDSTLPLNSNLNRVTWILCIHDLI